MPHHAECWKSNKKCTTFGCKGRSTKPGTGTQEEPKRGNPGLPVIFVLISIAIIVTSVLLSNQSEAPVIDPRPHPGAPLPQPYFTVTGIPSRVRTGQSFEFEIRVENLGIGVPTGSITASFTGNPDLRISRSDDTDPVIYLPGDKLTYINQRTGETQSIEARNRTVEAYYNDSVWTSNRTHFLKIRITPSRRGRLEIRIRCTQTLDAAYAERNNLPRFHTWPSDSLADGVDQQGLPVIVHVVEVN